MVASSKTVVASQSILRNTMLMQQSRAISMLQNKRTTTSVFTIQKSCFSSSEGKLNDSEIIEMVEGKVFEVLKSAAKCDHSKLSRTSTFD